MPARTGAEYLSGLREPRELWFEGERVRDVTCHPMLGRMAGTLAELYDLQCTAEHRDQLTYASPTTGQRVGLAFIQPRSVDDLVRRRRMFKAWADHTGGLLGRSPDYLNAVLAGLASSRPYFEQNGGEYGERIAAYYEHCRERDLCATHTFVDPQTNRARSQTDQADPDVPLHIEGESRQGLVVSGARMLATLAPYADELLVFPSPSRSSPADAPRYAFAFAIPMATPGLRFLCRQSCDPGGAPGDHPLSSRFEEMDAVAVFDEVVVPWDRVFLKGDPALCNGLFRVTNALTHGIHQSATKHMAKAELLLGVSSLVAEAIGRTGLPAYQQLLGEMVDVVGTVRAYVRAAEADAFLDRHGDFVPDPDILSTERNYFPRAYPRLVEILQLVASSGLMATPSERDLAAPEIAGDIERYYQSATLMGHERVRLFRLAWDLSCSAFAGRQVLYERFFSGDPAGLLAGRFHAYDRAAAIDRARALLATGR